MGKKVIWKYIFEKMSQSIFCLNDYQFIPLSGLKAKNITKTYRENVFNVSKSENSQIHVR